MISPFFKKVGLVFFGLILSLIVLELLLRLGGALWFSFQEIQNRIALEKKNAFRILCLGESTTALGGETSYPSQLEEILNNSYPRVCFSIVNKGTPSVFTTTIADDLKENLDRYKPDMVIAMMGINDYSVIVPYKTDRSAGTAAFLRRFKVYKLGCLLGRHAEALFEPQQEKKADLQSYLYKGMIDPGPKDDMSYVVYGNVFLDSGNFKKAEEMFAKAIELNPKNGRAYYGMGQVYQLSPKGLEETAAMYRKAVQYCPEYPVAHLWLGDCLMLQKKFDEAKAEFRKALELNPELDRAYIFFAWCLMRQGRLKEAEEVLLKGISVLSASDWLCGELGHVYEKMGRPDLANRYYEKVKQARSAGYDPTTRQSYLRVKRLLDERKIPLVCAQYPMRSLEPLRKMLEGEKGIIFVDNEGIFKNALKRSDYEYEAYFWDMFAGDFGHCTRKGNRLLAQNIADAILKEYFHKDVIAAENR